MAAMKVLPPPPSIRLSFVVLRNALLQLDARFLDHIAPHRVFILDLGGEFFRRRLHRIQSHF